MNETTRRERTQDVSGELSPVDNSRALVPLNQAPIRIRLPQAHGDAPGLLEHEIRRPACQPSFESDVSVPFWQAVLTGFAFGVMAAILALVFGWSWRIAAVTFGAVFAVTWLARMRLADSLLWEVERLTGHDFTGDGQIGQPGQPILVNPYEARQEAAQVRADDDTQHERQELTAFLHRCFTVGCSESAHGVKASGPDRESYVKYRDALIGLGIAAWRNPDRPRVGWRLVVSHAKAMELLSKYTL